MCFSLCNQYCSIFQLQISSSEDIFLFQDTFTSSCILRFSKLFLWCGSSSHLEVGPLLPAAIELWELLAGRGSSSLLGSKQGSSVKLKFCEILRISSYPGSLMALKFSSLTLRVGLQLRASRGSIPWSWSRAISAAVGREGVCQKHICDLASSDQRCQPKIHFNQWTVIFW